MMNKNLKLLSALSLALFGASAVKAQGFDLNGLSADDVRAMQADKGILDIIKPGKPEASKVTKEWTVMVFMNAKNDLAQSAMFGLSGKWAEKDIAEMKKVGTTDKVNVVVDYGTAGKGAKRMLIGKGGLLNSGETVYSQDANADQGDYRRAIEFVKWAKTAFPARHYMFIIWNHGLGWIDPDMKAHTAGTGASEKGISFDDETKNYIRTPQLGEILRQTGYVDVFAMNACLMQMAEVAYEVKDNAGLIVGSEETMLAYGFNYESLLNFLNANPAANGAQISDYFMNWERDFYANGAHVIGPINMPLSSIPATISTLEPRALNALPARLDALALAAMRNNETEAVRTAVADVIRFTGLDPQDKKKLIAPYADLYDFARIMGENARSAETRQAAQELMAFIKGSLVVRSLGINGDTENGYDYSKTGGIAINMTMKIKQVPPQLAAIYETKYGDLALSKASQWDEFVAWADGVWRN